MLAPWNLDEDTLTRLETLLSGKQAPSPPPSRQTVPGPPAGRRRVAGNNPTDRSVKLRTARQRGGRKAFVSGSTHRLFSLLARVSFGRSAGLRHRHRGEDGQRGLIRGR